MGANLQKADLSKTNLSDTNLKDASLDSAYLVFANLNNAAGLLGTEFGGANLTGTILPREISEFPALIEAEKIIKSAKRILIGQQFSLLILFAYSWLTILTTKDVQLISGLQSVTLPIIETKISVSVYYWIVPIILFSLYVYLGLLLKQLFTTMAILPAIFPHGRTIDQIGFPWIVNSLLRSYFILLRSGRSIFNNLQVYISNFFLWFTMPVTLLLFWGRYLPKHDWYGTHFHSLLFILSIWSGIALHREAISSFQRKKNIAKSKKLIFSRIIYMTIILTSLILMTFVSQSLLKGIHPRFTKERNRYSSINPKILIPRIFLKLGYDPLYINLKGEKLNWIDLTNSYLRYADARGISLIGSTLDGSDCNQTNFQWADLQKASLVGVDLEFANLRFAELKDTNLSGSNLKNVIGLTQIQINEACGDMNTKLPSCLFIKTCPAKD